MKLYPWIILSNATDGTDEEFNRWYDDVHVPDLLRIPGVKSAQRFKIADVQTALVNGDLRVLPTDATDLGYRYMAIYWIETDDLEAVFNEIRAKSGSEEMIISPTLKEALAMAYTEF